LIESSKKASLYFIIFGWLRVDKGNYSIEANIRTSLIALTLSFGDSLPNLT